jgi:hypothetical protein
MLTIRMSRRRRTFAAWLLLPVLALRAVIPVGFMPGSHAGLGIAMQLCTSQGIQTVIVNPDGSIEKGAPSSHHDAPCAYAVVGTAAPPPAAFAASVPSLLSSAPLIASRYDTPAEPAERAHAARGPPRVA